MFGGVHRRGGDGGVEAAVAARQVIAVDLGQLVVEGGIRQVELVQPLLDDLLLQNEQAVAKSEAGQLYLLLRGWLGRLRWWSAASGAGAAGFVVVARGRRWLGQWF